MVVGVSVDGDVVVMYLGTDPAMPVIPDSQSRSLDYNVCITCMYLFSMYFFLCLALFLCLLFSLFVWMAMLL